MSKFLTFEDRLIIEKGLRDNQSFGAIGKLIGKDRTTIAKEVKNMLLTKRQDIHLTHTMLAYIEWLAKKRMFAVPIALHNPEQNAVYATNVTTNANIFKKKFVNVDLSHHMFAMVVNSTTNAR